MSIQKYIKENWIQILLCILGVLIAFLVGWYVLLIVAEECAKNITLCNVSVVM